MIVGVIHRQTLGRSRSVQAVVGREEDEARSPVGDKSLVRIQGSSQMNSVIAAKRMPFDQVTRQLNDGLVKSSQPVQGGGDCERVGAYLDIRQALLSRHAHVGQTHSTFRPGATVSLPPKGCPSLSPDFKANHYRFHPRTTLQQRWYLYSTYSYAILALFDDDF